MISERDRIRAGLQRWQDEPHLELDFQRFLGERDIMLVCPQQPESVTRALERVDELEKTGQRIIKPRSFLIALIESKAPIVSTDFLGRVVYEAKPASVRDTTRINLWRLGILLGKEENGLPILNHFGDGDIGYSIKAQGLNLTLQQMRLLHMLWKEHDQVVSYKKLYTDLFCAPGVEVAIDSNSLKSLRPHISRLKINVGAKLEIQTVYGQGLRLCVEEKKAEVLKESEATKFLKKFQQTEEDLSYFGRNFLDWLEYAGFLKKWSEENPAVKLLQERYERILENRSKILSVPNRIFLMLMDQFGYPVSYKRLMAASAGFGTKEDDEFPISEKDRSILIQNKCYLVEQLKEETGIPDLIFNVRGLGYGLGIESLNLTTQELRDLYCSLME